MKKGVLHYFATRLNLWEMLRPADVGADIIRPRAIDNHPCGFK